MTSFCLHLITVYSTVFNTLKSHSVESKQSLNFKCNLQMFLGFGIYHFKEKKYWPNTNGYENQNVNKYKQSNMRVTHTLIMNRGQTSSPAMAGSLSIHILWW